MIKLTITRLFFLFILLFSSIKTDAQFLPKDDAKLNYNQIYFEYPFNENAKFYTLYLAYDSSQVKTDFNTFSILAKIDKTPATLIKNLTIGKKYKWYVETTLKSGEKINSETHNFSILNTKYNDINLYKRKINYKSKQADGVIWCDFSHCAFDRNGDIVWFMPSENSEYKESSRVRDIRFQKDGTLTFVKNPGALHTTLDIEKIWEAPLSGEESEKFKNGYHHCFQKLANGNYMALAYDYVELEKTEKQDTSSNRVELVNLIEFNKTGDIVWIWEMRQEFPLDVLAIPKENNRGIIDAHCNAFSVDKDNKYVYIGYRDISRIIKIEKSTKKIVASYGKKLNDADSLVTVTNLFSYPHDAKILENNSIMVLNNNDFNAGKIASIEIFNQTKKYTEKVNSTWSFKFNFDTLNSGKSLKLGNVKLLDNGNYLINEGSSNRIVEITKNKKVLWDMMLYRYDVEKKKWANAGPYRIDYSTSLYPYYFSVNYSKNNSLLTIFNEGDYKDSYTVELLDSNNNIIQTNSTRKNIHIQKKQDIKLDNTVSNTKSIRIISNSSKKEKIIHLN